MGYWGFAVNGIDFKKGMSSLAGSVVVKVYGSDASAPGLYQLDYGPHGSTLSHDGQVVKRDHFPECLNVILAATVPVGQRPQWTAESFEQYAFGFEEGRKIGYEQGYAEHQREMAAMRS